MSGPCEAGFGLKISPGVVLRNLLQQYPSGGQFFLEALQNTDDTGRAKKFCALLDLRRHPTGKLREPRAARSSLQGEAIVFYDDAGFEQRDWRSLQFMCDSEKRQSPHEAGAFGMGSRSFFHITDVLQVLSGTKLASLDPDDILETGHFGEQLDFTSPGGAGGLGEFPCPDECAPFLGLFGCDMHSEFAGTIIRASLRKEERAKSCSFMPQAFDVSRAERIFTEFQETLRNGEVMLFLSCISLIELWRWDSGATEASLISRSHLGASSGHGLPGRISSPGDVKSYLRRFRDFGEVERALAAQEPPVPEIFDLVDIRTQLFDREGGGVGAAEEAVGAAGAAGAAPAAREGGGELVRVQPQGPGEGGGGEELVRRWLRVGRFSTEPELLSLVGRCSSVPLVAVALPVGGPAQGALYASLPLPIQTSLPVHVNGCFRLHDNRRAIWRLTPDLDGEHRLWAEWNELLLTRLLPQVYARALHCLATTLHLAEDKGFSVWPRSQEVDRHYALVLDPLVASLAQTAMLSSPSGELLRPLEALCFSTPTKALQACRKQLLQLCAAAGWKVVDLPEHAEQLLRSRLALQQRSCKDVLLEVVLPAARDLQNQELSRLLLAFLDWAASWSASELEELALKLGTVAWLPREDGSVCCTSQAFDPERSPLSFSVVRQGRAHIAGHMEGMKIDEASLWRVLHLCGVKTEITWEDAVTEAESLILDGDVQRATLLFQHVNRYEHTLRGDRQSALARLQSMPWLPATQASGSRCDKQRQTAASQLLPPSAVFPASAGDLVWAVAPVLCSELEPRVPELRPGRSVEAEPETLLEQVAVLVASATAGRPPCIDAVVLGHLRVVFGGLAAFLPKLQQLDEHPRLRDLPFIPCLVDEATDPAAAALFTPKQAAFRAQHDHRALSPAVGIVKPGDHVIRIVAEAANVSREPRADVLAELLEHCGGASTDAQSAGMDDLAVTLAVELAGRLRCKETRPSRVLVPSTSGRVELSEKVYIDDAPWKHGDIVTLHQRISAEDGRLLGCSSLRDEMARQCEDRSTSTEGDPFGQEADLVSQVRQLLLEYGDQADLVTEFVQNSDDAGARHLLFALREESFGTERVVDSRTDALQGPALYICSDKPLSDEDIVRMQTVGHSKKRLEVSSSGRFGVGLNVMYRYCDCPQLLANGGLHYFDLTRSFVAKPGMKRGRKFAEERLKQNFPDSYAPFESDEAVAKFPTVFRLALRAERSELGLKMDSQSVRRELQHAASLADKMLLFTKHLQRIEFLAGNSSLATHEATIKDPAAHQAFFDGLPKSPLDFKAGCLHTFLSQRSIATTAAGVASRADWVITHRIGVTDESMYDVLKAQFERPHGVALLPHGAAAARVDPFEKARNGHVCSGLPTGFRTNSSAWVNGTFALLSSRKSLPVPEEAEDPEHSLDKTWNRMLLEGPVAQSMLGVIVHCSALVMYQGLSLDGYFSLFPIRGERLQTILALATFRAALRAPVFPVVRGLQVTWVPGPFPTFVGAELPAEVQRALVADGLRLVSLPEELLAEYEAALGKPRQSLGAHELCKFLRETWARLHPRAASATGGEKEKGEAEVELELPPAETGIAALMQKSYVTALLAFVAKGLWKAYCSTSDRNPHSFNFKELLGVPLLMTHAQEVTTFSLARSKFSTWRDMLPSKRSIFIDREVYGILIDAVDTTAENVNVLVQTDFPGIKPFSLLDLIPYRSEFEESINPQAGFTSLENAPLRLFWSLVAESELSAWSDRVQDWKVLPVLAKEGEGENGEICVSMQAAPACVAVPLVEQDAHIVKNLTGILLQCGIHTIQAEVLSDERIEQLLRPFVICTNEALIHVLRVKGNMASLGGVQRHDLLAHFSVLCVKAGDAADFTAVAALPLFRTTAVESTFVSLEMGKSYCCIDPVDTHANAIGKLMPPDMVMLAWPTSQVKPIYEHCGIKLCNGEEFMVSLMIPRLPALCKEDKDGADSAPVLAELHAYACIDVSEKVKQAAAECAFVPSEDLSRLGISQEFTSPVGGAAAAFVDVIRPHLPVKWMQQNPQHLELLAALGMQQDLSPAMIALCARSLDEAYAAELRAAEVEATAPAADTDPDPNPNPATAPAAPESDPAAAATSVLAGAEAAAAAAADAAAAATAAAATAARSRSAGAPSQAPAEAEGRRAAAGQSTSASGDTSPAPGTLARRTEAPRLSQGLLTKSFELVEEFARAANEIWPKPKAKTPATGIPGSRLALTNGPNSPNIEDMTKLLEAGSLRILTARRHRCEETLRREAAERNQKCPTKKESDLGVQHADLELVPFKGAAFKTARQVLWSVCPLEDHHNPAGPTENGTSLKALLDNHSGGMYHVFGAFVLAQHAPLTLILKHLSCLCALQQSELGLGSIRTGCALHEDLRACWKGLSENSEHVTQSDVQEAVAKLCSLPCVAVTSEDVADRPADVTLLTLPKYSFFQLPLLRGKEAAIRLYLRQVMADNSQEASVFRALGAKEKPGALDYATASQRVAEKVEKLGHAGWEWVVTVLEVCMRGVFEDVDDTVAKGAAAPQVENLHMFTADGRVEHALRLVWADEPRWLRRCQNEESLQFCTLNGQDQRDMALCFVKCAGLRQLSTLVEERRLSTSNDDAASAASSSAQDPVERLVQSFEFACGLRAVMCHTQDGGQRALKHTVRELSQALKTIKFRVAKGGLQSALFWKAGPMAETKGDMPLKGSEQEQQVYFDESDRSVYVRGSSTPGTRGQEDGFAAELVAALSRALPLLWQVDAFLLEALLRCAFQEGAAAIPRFLERRDIKIASLASRQLGPGDPLPEDLHDHVVWSMEATFGEGECAAVLVSESFTIAEVAKWPSGQHAGDGINRSYLIRVSADGFETRKHFEVYKIHGSPVPSTAGDLIQLDSAQDAKETDAGAKGNDGAQDSNARHMAEVKRYLHEMGKMAAADYKIVMRRLFKTWHPDKIGDTPLANSIFRLLRRHEQWYKKHLTGEEGDDSWLDADDGSVWEEPAAPSTSSGTGTLALAPRTYEPEPGLQGSWFDEFEREVQQATHIRAARCKSMARPPEAAGSSAQEDSAGGGGLPGGSPLGPGGAAAASSASSVRKRIVDRAQAPRWLQQAKLELLAARRLVHPIDGVRALPATAVWHCQQVVEMATKSAMFRTCGVAEDEIVGGSAHDIADFAKRLSGGVVNTEEQRRAQRVPADADTMDWLKRAYLAARYPKPGRYGIPGLQYAPGDAERALRLAEDFVKWAAHVEDLPDMLVDNTRGPTNDVLEDIRKRRWSNVAEAAGLPEEEVNQIKSHSPFALQAAQAALASPGPAASKAGSKPLSSTSAAVTASSAIPSAGPPKAAAVPVPQAPGSTAAEAVAPAVTAASSAAGSRGGPPESARNSEQEGVSHAGPRASGTTGNSATSAVPKPPATELGDGTGTLKRKHSEAETPAREESPVKQRRWARKP